MITDDLKKSSTDLILFIIISLLYVYYKPNDIIHLNLQIGWFFILIIFLAVFKRFYLINYCFKFQNNEKKITFIILSLTLIFFALLSFVSPIKYGFDRIFDNSITFVLYTAIQTLIEELIFRVYLLAALIDFAKIPLKNNKNLVYWTEGKKNYCKLIGLIFFVSLIFSISHPNWYDNWNLLMRFFMGIIFALLFVLTNKKVYAPWAFHFSLNMFTENYIFNNPIILLIAPPALLIFIIKKNITESN